METSAYFLGALTALVVVALVVTCVSETIASRAAKLEHEKRHHEQAGSNASKDHALQKPLRIIQIFGLISSILVVVLIVSAWLRNSNPEAYTAIFGLALVICTIVQIVVASLQLSVADITAQAAKQSAEAAEKNAWTMWLTGLDFLYQGL